MGKKIFHAVAARIDVELVRQFQLVEFLMESPRALVKAETVLAAAIEVDFEAGYLRGVSLGQNKRTVFIPEGDVDRISK